jgi:hypothetical protein
MSGNGVRRLTRDRPCRYGADEGAAATQFTEREIRMAVTIDGSVGLSRYMPAQLVCEAARAYEASGVIDGLCVWDQLMFMIPPSLWTEKSTPMAAAMPDPDSFNDPFATLAYAASAAPSMNLMVGTDASRRGPAELAQSMLTLSGMTTGSVTSNWALARSSSSSRSG